MGHNGPRSMQVAEVALGGIPNKTSTTTLALICLTLVAAIGLMLTFALESDDRLFQSALTGTIAGVVLTGLSHLVDKLTASFRSSSRAHASRVEAVVNHHAERMEVATSGHAARMEVASVANIRDLGKSVLSAERWWVNGKRADVLSDFDAALAVEAMNGGTPSDTGPFKIINGGMS